MGRIAKTDEEFEKIRRRIYTCPACTTADVYNKWMKEAMKIKPPYSTWFCTDCTPTFAAYNRMRGCCDRPEIRFRKDADSGIEGYAPRQVTGRRGE